MVSNEYLSFFFYFEVDVNILEFGYTHFIFILKQLVNWFEFVLALLGKIFKFQKSIISISHRLNLLAL